MKEKNENKLDQLFKDGISGSEDRFAFREEDWASMEQLLDGKPAKKVVPLFRIIYYASGIAALLLLAIGIFYFNNNDKTDPKHTKLYGSTKPANNNAGAVVKPDTISDAASKTINNGSVTAPSNSEEPSLANNNPVKHTQTNIIKPPTHPLPVNKVKDTISDGSMLANNKTSVTPKTVTPDAQQANNKVDNQIASTGNQVQNGISANQPDTITELKTPVQQNKKESFAMKTTMSNRPQFSLSILAAPDVNGVNSFNRSQVGTNFGVQLSVKLTKKLSISTGAAYAVKPYQANFGDYKSTVVRTLDPINVAANCKVLDIPLNMNYQVYSKGRNALALGTGLSSYFMLKENYRFDYSAESGWKSYNLQVNNENQHLFGVLNVNATYQRKINSKFSAVVQPYLKLPLTGIGNGKVDLQSTGVAVGISWDINSVLKPK